MITLISPTHIPIAQLADNDLESYVEANWLRAIPISHRKATYTVIPQEQGRVLDKITKGSVVSFSGFDPEIGILKRFEELLADHDEVVFAPSKHSLRHMHTPAGFAAMMNEVLAALKDCELSLPAGQYGDHYLFAIKRMN